MVQNSKIKLFIDGLAFLISAIFSPYVTGAVFIILVSYKYAANLGEFLPWVLIFLFFAIILPGLYILWLLETGKIKDIHMADRNERKWPFMIAGFSSVLGMIILFELGTARPVFALAVTYAAIALLVGLITLFWKISVHTAIFASIVTIAVIVYSPFYAWLYLILVPLAWSRIHRKRHTLLQTIAGALLAFVVTVAVFWAFGYI